VLLALVVLEFPAMEPAVLFWVSPMAVLPVTALLLLTAGLALVAAGGVELEEADVPPATVMVSLTEAMPGVAKAKLLARSRSSLVATVPVRSAMPLCTFTWTFLRAGSAVSFCWI
jgi:hypothetical protein